MYNAESGSFFNDQKIKDKYVKRMAAHRQADELIRGVGFQEGKGCFIGCILNNYDHSQFENELNIPEWVGRVFDVLYEGMSIDRYIEFTTVLEDIPLGSDLNKIKRPFMIFILESLFDQFDNEKFPEVTQAIKKVIDLHQSNSDSEAAWAAAWAAANDKFADELIRLIKEYK